MLGLTLDLAPQFRAGVQKNAQRDARTTSGGFGGEEEEVRFQLIGVPRDHGIVTWVLQLLKCVGGMGRHASQKLPKFHARFDKTGGINA